MSKEYDIATGNITTAGPSKSLVLSLNKVAANLIKFHYAVCYFTPGGLVLREATPMDDNVSMIRKDRVGVETKTLNIRGAANKEDLLGFYEMYEFDGEFILVKRPKGSDFSDKYQN